METIDTRRLRAEALRGFIRLAQHVLANHPTINTVFLGCSQYYCDEAGDAVHDTVRASTTWRPGMRTDDERYEEDIGVGYEDRSRFLSWDDNGGAIYAFAPMCNEEGWTDEDSNEYGEGGTLSPVACVHRLPGGALGATWLGALHRPWLDFPEGMADREDYFGDDEEPDFTPDPEPAALVGREVELYAQVLAEPGNHGARDVLADVWIMRDDPRGHFTVACRAQDRTHVAELVLEHGRAWLGPLGAVIPLAGALFAHGPFIEKAIVYGEADVLARHADAREWATVREIVFAPESARLISPAMTSLRSVGPIGAAELPMLAGHAIEELDYDGPVEALAGIAVKTLIVRAMGAIALVNVQAERVELWLPGTESALEVAAAHRDSVVPAGATLMVGVLHGHQRTGLVYTGTAIEVYAIDARDEQGVKWSKALDLPVPATHIPAGDDWLAYALGVA